VRPSLQGEQSVDVGIVGGGIAGCSAALHLALRGYRVALLEANTVGYGGSGRSGGQTIFGLAVSQEKLVAQLGAGDARRVFDFSIEALELTQSLIKRYAIDCDYRPNHLHVAVKARQARELENWTHELHDQYGYRSVSYLGRAELAAHVRSERFHGGLLDTRSGHLHSLKYTQGLARAAESHGARIFEHSCALKFSAGHAGGGPALQTPGTVWQCVPWCPGPCACAAGAGRRHLYHRDRTPRARGCCRIAAKQCRGGRHQLDSGLFPALG
jgi:gamma-glutamylputrescine oxidase